MKKILAIANTHFQLIILLNLRWTLYKEDYMDIIVSDEISGYKDIIKRLKNVKVFNNVYYADAVKLLHGNMHMRRKEFLKAIFFSYSYLKKISDINLGKYDYVMFDNTDSLLTHIVYNYLERENKNIKGIFFEEAVGVCNDNRIYLTNYKIYKLLHLKNKILRRRSIDLCIRKYLCFQPQYVKANVRREKIEKIPDMPVNNSEFINTVNEVYDYKNNRENYHYPYVFFEESFMSNNGEEDINDMELIEKIVETVGKENIIIKRHPRNRINRFKDKNIPYNHNLGIPWEVILLNESFDDTTFLTISSSAVLSSKLYFKSKNKVYLLLNCTNRVLERQKIVVDAVEHTKEITGDYNSIIIYNN